MYLLFVLQCTVVCTLTDEVLVLAIVLILKLNLLI